MEYVINFYKAFVVLNVVGSSPTRHPEVRRETRLFSNEQAGFLFYNAIRTQKRAHPHVVGIRPRLVASQDSLPTDY